MTGSPRTCPTFWARGCWTLHWLLLLGCGCGSDCSSECRLPPPRPVRLGRGCPHSQPLSEEGRAEPRCRRGCGGRGARRSDTARRWHSWCLGDSTRPGGGRGHRERQCVHSPEPAGHSGAQGLAGVINGLPGQQRQARQPGSMSGAPTLCQHCSECREPRQTDTETDGQGPCPSGVKTNRRKNVTQQSQRKPFR